jgi:hypothetical protein
MKKEKFIKFIPLRYCVFNQMRYLTEYYKTFFCFWSEYCKI